VAASTLKYEGAAACLGAPSGSFFCVPEQLDSMAAAQHSASKYHRFI
jgi:hypothetical protein